MKRERSVCVHFTMLFVVFFLLHNRWVRETRTQTAQTNKRTNEWTCIKWFGAVALVSLQLTLICFSSSFHTEKEANKAKNKPRRRQWKLERTNRKSNRRSDGGRATAAALTNFSSRQTKLIIFGKSNNEPCHPKIYIFFYSCCHTRTHSLIHSLAHRHT